MTAFSVYIILMEESKRKEIREYIESQVNPVIRPLVEEIVRKRPSNIPGYINEYTFKLMSNYYDIKITEKRLVLNLIQMKKMKKKKLSSCANLRLRRKRRLTRNTVGKESVLRSLVNSTKRLNLYPVLLPKVQRQRIRLEALSKKAFSLAT